MAEYESVRREIEMMIQQQERTFNYLLALVGALLASQFVVGEFPEVEAALERRPELYLVVAILTLWFPIQNIILNFHIGTMAQYLRLVLMPKVNYICATAAASSDLVALGDWDARNLDQDLHGVMLWEVFRVKAQFEQRRHLVTLTPLWTFRFVILAVPGLVLIVRYVDVRWIRANIDWLMWLEWPLVLLTALLMVGLVVGGASRGNLVVTHRRMTGAVPPAE